MENLKRFSKPGFILLLIFFVLPFVKISCGSEQTMKYNGIDLAAGKTIKDPTTNKPMRVQEPLALLALLAAAMGLAFSFSKHKLGTVLTAGAGLATFILLEMLDSHIQNEMLENGYSLIFSVQMEFGFYLAVLLSAIMGVGTGIVWFKERQKN